MIRIYHNPRCSKSRQTLQLIQQQEIEPCIIDYLKTPVSVEEISEILSKLKIPAAQLLRTNEAEYKMAGLSTNSSELDCIQAMHNYPKLMQRPIVVNGEKAAIGRPPESILEIL